MSKYELQKLKKCENGKIVIEYSYGCENKEDLEKLLEDFENKDEWRLVKVTSTRQVEDGETN